MRTVVCLALLSVIPGLADDATDSAAIEQVVAAWNMQSKPLSDLLFPGAPDVQALLPEEPWSEVTRPYITIRSIHFFTSSTAFVEADSTQYGSVMLKQNKPLAIVLRKYGVEWRIACALSPN